MREGAIQCRYLCNFAVRSLLFSSSPVFNNNVGDSRMYITMITTIDTYRLTFIEDHHRSGCGQQRVSNPRDPRLLHSLPICANSHPNTAGTKILTPPHPIWTALFQHYPFESMQTRVVGPQGTRSYHRSRILPLLVYAGRSSLNRYRSSVRYQHNIQAHQLQVLGRYHALKTFQDLSLTACYIWNVSKFFTNLSPEARVSQLACFIFRQEFVLTIVQHDGRFK